MEATSQIKTIEEVVREHIIKTYLALDLNKRQTAFALGISHRTLYNHLTKYQDQGHFVDMKEELIKMQRRNPRPDSPVANEAGQAEVVSDMEQPIEDRFTELDFWIFPTNEERLKYRDDMLNRDAIWGTPSLKDSTRRSRL